MSKQRNQNYEYLINNKDYKYKENDPDYQGNHIDDDLCIKFINFTLAFIF